MESRTTRHGAPRRLPRGRWTSRVKVAEHSRLGSLSDSHESFVRNSREMGKVYRRGHVRTARGVVGGNDGGRSRKVWNGFGRVGLVRCTCIIEPYLSRKWAAFRCVGRRRGVRPRRTCWDRGRGRSLSRSRGSTRRRECTARNRHRASPRPIETELERGHRDGPRMRASRATLAKLAPPWTSP